MPTLNHMKSRPGVWFREGSYLDGLYCFLLGYSVSAENHADLKVFALGPDFSRWLLDCKGLTGDNTMPWAEILYQNCDGDEAGFNTALQLISEFNDWPEIDGDLTKF